MFLSGRITLETMLGEEYYFQSDFIQRGVECNA